MSFIIDIPEEVEKKFWATGRGARVLCEIKVYFIFLIMEKLSECTTDEEVMGIGIPEVLEPYIRKMPEPESKFGEAG